MWYPNRTSIISDIKKVPGKYAQAVTYGSPEGYTKYRQHWFHDI